jgi:acetyl esterase/lipase
MEQTAAYENGAHIPEAELYPPRWAMMAAAFRARLGKRARLDLHYGPGAREALDLFMPEGAPRGLMVFVHGGYWMAFGREDWSHLAAGALARGYAVAMPSYDLCPDVRIAQITKQVARAVRFAAGLVEGPLGLTGHSAGGHLVARMAAPGMLPEAVSARLARIVPISPLADLRPLLQTEMNGTLRLDQDEAVAESPLAQPVPGCPVHVWVGAEERPAFLDQARWLSDGWGCPLTKDRKQHHFNVIEGLRDPESPLCEALFDGI